MARAIQVQRGDFNGVVLTIRSAGHGALLAAILGVHPEAVVPRLAELGVIYRPAD